MPLYVPPIEIGAYRTLHAGGGRASTSAASGTKYFMIPTVSDSSAPAVATSASYLFHLVAADYAVAGFTAKLRIRVVEQVATAPAITTTPGLYPVTAGSTLSLGTVIAGSTTAITTPAINTITTGNSGDFDLPSDGVYALGYIVSGTPSGNHIINAYLQVHWV